MRCVCVRTRFRNVCPFTRVQADKKQVQDARIAIDAMQQKINLLLLGLKNYTGALRRVFLIVWLANAANMSWHRRVHKRTLTHSPSYTETHTHI